VSAALEPAPQRRLARTPDGIPISLVHWPAPSARPRWTLLIAHGLGEHAGRYQAFAEWFVRHDAEVVALDHRGHGLSGGPRGHTPSLQRLLDDLDQVISLVYPPPGRPLVLIGHSLGGLIAVAYALAYPERIDRAVFSAPALLVKQRVSVVKVALSRALSRLTPGLALANEIDVRLLSRDQSIVEAYRTDPLVHNRISARLYRETIGRGRQLIARAPRLRVPFLLLHGEADGLVDPRGSRAFFARATAPGRAFKTYPGLYHEIFNEPERERVFEDILAWLNA